MYIFPDTEVAVFALKTPLHTLPGHSALRQPTDLGRGHHGGGAGQAPRLPALLPLVGIPEHTADVRPLSKLGQALLADILSQREGRQGGRRCRAGWSLEQMGAVGQQRLNTTEDGAEDSLDSFRRIVVDLDGVNHFLEGVNDVSDDFLLGLLDDSASLYALLSSLEFSPDHELLQQTGSSRLHEPGQVLHHPQVGTRSFQDVGEITVSLGDHGPCQHGKK